MSARLTYHLQPRRPPWGVRVDPRKAISLARPIARAALPDRAQLPLALPDGRIASPMLPIGAPVLTGQPIARFADSPIRLCAPISGRLGAIVERQVPMPTVRPTPCMQIDGDGEDRWHPDCRPLASPERVTPERLCDLIGAAGILGLGGAQFPTAEKLRSGRGCQLLILNGAECEPYISCDERLMRDCPQRVTDGTALMLHALGAGQAVIAVESDMPEARIALKDSLASGSSTGIDVAVVTAKYPAGGERQLIELLTGLEVPVNGLPADLGLLCQNVATAVAVSDLVRAGRPLVARVVTVTGSGVASPGNFEARIGTPLAELVAAAGGYTAGDCELYMGGPMMGVALPDDRIPVSAATNCLIVARPGEFPRPPPEFPCIRCGECSRVCPARLMPQDLLDACRAGEREQLSRLHVEACIECGCCDYVCPSHLVLTARFAEAKATQRQWQEQRRRAARARTRSEAHRARLAERRDELVDGPRDPQEADLALAELLQRARRHDSD